MTISSTASNYDKDPIIDVLGTAEGAAWRGWPGVIAALRTALESLERPGAVLTIDTYPGVDLNEIWNALRSAWPELQLIDAEAARLPPARIDQMIERNLTDDRVFGVMSCHELPEFYDAELLLELRARADSESGPVAVIGTGAALVHPGDILVLADLPRWERQLRLRRGDSNWATSNPDEDILRKYKRGFFWEWRIADRHKRSLLTNLDFLLDTTSPGDPKLVTGGAFRAGLHKVARRPFRLVPYFDVGVWGGTWMREVCGLDKSVENYAWGFDGVPEENSLKLRYGDVVLEVPAIDLVFSQPKELLGERVFARFGAEFPIRFDFLDTMGGQNLSLQVHPLVQYVQEHFGMHYTQDESYYFLDAGDDACVYLGLKEGVKVSDFATELEAGASGSRPVDDAGFVNRFAVKKHDHVLIPAGTVHCAGRNAMVLEVSATPYIFTFKLWDWGRLGLDGLPRPVHIEHGIRVIQADRDTAWVQSNLLNRVEPLAASGEWREERTGLHELEFIETRRHWFTGPVHHQTNGSVHVLNLVHGREAVVESPSRAFAPLVVHYAETFIVPAAVGEYVVRPHGESAGHELATLCASVRV